MLKAKGNVILKLSVFLLVLILGTTTCFAMDVGKNEVKGRQFKVIGYYSGDLFNEPVEKLQTDKLTHVIYAFLIPKEDGTLVDLEKPEQLRELTEKAHKDGAKVFIALGGWSYKGKPLVSVFETVSASKEKRKLLIDNVCSLVKEYDLDGVEVDWEHPNANTMAVIKDDRTYIPLRAVFNAFKYDVVWHGRSNTVYINELGSV